MTRFHDLKTAPNLHLYCYHCNCSDRSGELREPRDGLGEFHVADSDTVSSLQSNRKTGISSQEALSSVSNVRDELLGSEAPERMASWIYTLVSLRSCVCGLDTEAIPTISMNVKAVVLAAR